MVRKRNTLAACALALLVLAGCSGDGKDEASTPPAPDPGGGASTTVRPVDTSFTGQNSGPFCALSKTYNERFGNLNTGSSPAQLRASTAEGRTAITQAAAAAPAEIKPDVQVIANAFTTILSELEKVNFDISKMSPTAVASLQAPEFQASTARFQSYLRTVCGTG